MSVGSVSTIVWFRNDLRLTDNPALAAAVRRPGSVMPVFIWDPLAEEHWQPGAASRWWLHHSLANLDRRLRQVGSRLIIRCGESRNILLELARETQAKAVFWNRRYEPAIVARDRTLKADLRALGLEAESFNAALLFEPWEVQTSTGKPFQVFTPFWKACLALPEPEDEYPCPTYVPPPAEWPRTQLLETLHLEPAIDWAGGVRATWRPGEDGARLQLEQLLNDVLVSYAQERDRPDLSGTSRLSPHLHFGEMGPRQVWRAVRHQLFHLGPSVTEAAASYLRQLGWREFASHLLFHFPSSAELPLRSEFNAFPWREDADAFRAWSRGRTGYPLVDAGMRELWTTGWMHNRVRMVAASFLVKDLLLPWQLGARWFWDTLVDADLANNTLGWQWTAGCGADAAPYFRIFNPVKQGEKFDRRGDYVRHWVPELSRLPDNWIHQPWEAPQGLLQEAGVMLGDNYPHPIVTHATARLRALAGFASLQENKGSKIAEKDSPRF